MCCMVGGLLGGFALRLAFAARVQDVSVFPLFVYAAFEVVVFVSICSASCRRVTLVSVWKIPACVVWQYSYHHSPHPCRPTSHAQIHGMLMVCCLYLLQGQTALMLAAAKNNTQIVKLLEDAMAAKVPNDGRACVAWSVGLSSTSRRVVSVCEET